MGCDVTSRVAVHAETSGGIGTWLAWKPLAAAVALGGLFVATLTLRMNPDAFDYPVMKALMFAGTSDFGGRIAAAASYPALQGVTVVSLMWGCWFYQARPEARVRLVRGAIVAVLAGIAAHGFHDLLPPMARPIFDPNLHSQPSGVLASVDSARATGNPGGSSYPSERATMFAGLALAILMVNRGIGVAAVGATSAIEICRIYMGLHFATDIIGSFLLAAATLWFVEVWPDRGRSLWLVRQERAWIAIFYAGAFVFAYGVATAFQDLR